MTKENYTHLTIIADRSGSMGMADMHLDAQGGINTMIKEQAAVDGEITVTVYDFDHEYRKVFGPIDAKEAPEYELIPRGSTALMDAVGRAISETGSYLKQMSEDERPQQVVFVIATDGGENASREITQAKLKEMIKHQEDKYDWQFVFLAANIDAFATGAGYGMRNNVQYANTGASMRGAYAAASSALVSSRITGDTMDTYFINNTNVDEDGNVSQSSSS